MSNEKAGQDNVWKKGAENVSLMKRPVKITCRKKGLEKAERREGILYIK